MALSVWFTGTLQLFSLVIPFNFWLCVFSSTSFFFIISFNHFLWFWLFMFFSETIVWLSQFSTFPDFLLCIALVYSSSWFRSVISYCFWLFMLSSVPSFQFVSIFRRLDFFQLLCSFLLLFMISFRDFLWVFIFHVFFQLSYLDFSRYLPLPNFLQSLSLYCSICLASWYSFLLVPLDYACFRLLLSSYVWIFMISFSYFLWFWLFMLSSVPSLWFVSIFSSS